MNFDKAYNELLSGKKIRRKEWEKFMHLRMIDDAVKTFRGENIQYSSTSTILMSKGWKVVDGDGTELTFLEAIEELKLKKSITNDKMNDAFIFIDNGQWALCRPVEYDFMPTFQCLCSNDWEILK